MVLSRRSLPILLLLVLGLAWTLTGCSQGYATDTADGGDTVVTPDTDLTPDADGCVPLTCAQRDADCGDPSDGCGGELDCGVCVVPLTCSIINRCTCVADCLDKLCGDKDGCDETCTLGSGCCVHECDEDGEVQCDEGALSTCGDFDPDICREWSDGTPCESGVCLEDGCCEASCGDKECGDNGCGEPCGSCPGAAPICNDAGLCVAKCTGNCDGKECGLDGCGESCGTCPDEMPLCDLEGVCHTDCKPSCGDKLCGDDGCGGSCGECAESEYCADSACAVQICTPNSPYCDGDWVHICNEEGSGPSASGDFLCLLMGDQETCVDGTCQCVPACEGKECGPDGCGGECGSCPGAASTCTAEGTCVAVCQPACDGKTCGADGCGDSCGFCSQPTPICSDDGICIEDTPGCTNECDFQGQTTCYNGNWYQECGDWDADVCLEWNSPGPCGGTGNCVSGACQEEPDKECSVPMAPVEIIQGLGATGSGSCDPDNILLNDGKAAEFWSNQDGVIDWLAQDVTACQVVDFGEVCAVNEICVEAWAGSNGCSGDGCGAGGCENCLVATKTSLEIFSLDTNSTLNFEWRFSMHIDATGDPGAVMCYDAGPDPLRYVMVCRSGCVTPSTSYNANVDYVWLE